VSIRLDMNTYAETTIRLLLDQEKVTQKQLLKHIQNVAVVYACLGVKRNGSVLGTEAKYTAAAAGFKNHAVPGLFKWAEDHSIQFPSWLTMEKMGCTSLKGGKRRWKLKILNSCYVLLYNIRHRQHQQFITSPEYAQNSSTALYNNNIRRAFFVYATTPHTILLYQVGRTKCLYCCTLL